MDISLSPSDIEIVQRSQVEVKKRFYEEKSSVKISCNVVEKPLHRFIRMISYFSSQRMPCVRLAFYFIIFIKVFIIISITIAILLSSFLSSLSILFKNIM